MSDPSQNDPEIKMSYAQWLTTPSSSVSLDRVPEPWFSSEIRDAQDQRLRWIDLSQIDGVGTESEITEQYTQQTVGHSRTSRNQADVRKLSHHEGKSQDLNQDKPSPEEGVVGHYLDHIEVVKLRDEERSTHRKGRSRRKRRSKNASRPHTRQEQSSQTSPSQDPQKSFQGPAQSKPKRRRRRGKNKTQTKAD